MTSLQIKNILIPTDFSKTGLLAVEHAAFMAQLFKADLYLLHVIEITESSFSIYGPAVQIRDIKEVEKAATGRLNDLAEKLKKEYALNVMTLCNEGKMADEVIAAVKEYDIDVVVMGTHGASGFHEIFIGSNAHKIVSVCPCPVITVRAHAEKLGFTNIVLPVDNSFYSRQKVDYAIMLAKKFAAKINVVGLLAKGEDVKKFEIKLESIEKILEKTGLPYECKIVKGDNLAATALKFSKKLKADLIVVLANHESYLNGMFLEVFAKQIVNHSRVPVMSIRPKEAYEPLALSGANPF